MAEAQLFVVGAQQLQQLGNPRSSGYERSRADNFALIRLTGWNPQRYKWGHDAWHKQARSGGGRTQSYDYDFVLL